jgi:hypothetical protein
MTDLDELRAALNDVGQKQWLADAEARLRTEPDAAGSLFARAGRQLGREPVAPGWTAGQAGRAILLALLPPDRITVLYQQGDANERLAVLKALPLLAIGDAAVPLLHDALRTNDTRLVAAALGPYAAHLDAATWRQGVIKCVFMGVPLDVVDRLDERADRELAAMLRGLAEERSAAGRTMPADATALLTRMEEPS